MNIKLYAEYWFRQSGKSLQQANRALHRRDYDAALAACDDALERSPQFALAYYYRSLIFMAKGDLDLAILSLAQAVRLSESQPKYHLIYQFWLIVTKYLKGLIVEAITDLDQLLLANPSKLWRLAIYSYRGLMYRQLENITYALRDYNDALTLAGEFNFLSQELFLIVVSAYTGRAQAFSAKGLFSYAKGDLKRAFKYAKSRNANVRSVVYSAQAIVLARQENYEIALESSKQAISLAAPDNRSLGHAYCVRAEVQKLKGNFDEALKDLTESIRLIPQFAQPYLERSKLYDQLGKQEEAEKDRQQIELLKREPVLEDPRYMQPPTKPNPIRFL